MGKAQINKKEIFDYLTKFENKEHVPTWARKKLKRKHDYSLIKIASNPNLIYLKKEFIPEIEIQIYNKENNQVGEIDLILTNEKECYIIEYKSHNTEKNRKKAKEQLNLAQKYLPKKFKRDITRLFYVQEKYEVQELIDQEWKMFLKKTPQE